MNRRERVLRALEMEEPDRVPLSEVDIDVPLMEAITGMSFPAATSLQTQVIADRDMERRRVDLKADCYEKIGFDMFTVDLSAPEDWEPTVNPDGTMRPCSMFDHKYRTHEEMLDDFVENNTCADCYVSIRAYLSQPYHKLLLDNIRERVLSRGTGCSCERDR